MQSVLKTLARHGDISELSYYFAKFIAAQDNQPIDSLLALSAALVSEANQQGDVCIMLDRYQSLPLFVSETIAAEEIPVAPELSVWQQTLLSSNCVTGPGQLAPMILEGGRLYLYRYWYYESELAASIRTRLKNEIVPNQANLINSLKTLYPDQTFNQQQLAVALAVKHRFAVISGGPGTGKTTTVINILAVLLLQQADMRIKLAAPTGKAAARMMESIRHGIDNCRLDDSLRKRIPTQAGTIHRLLGYRRDGFRYSRQHRLPLDCVVIDEASMIDLTLMHHLLDALQPDARVILLGDRDQLASVAAGNVLGDITGRGLAINYSTEQGEWLKALFKPTDDYHLQSATTGIAIADSIALLTHSFRFETQGGIGKLAQLVNTGDSSAVIDLLQQADNPLRWYKQQSNDFDSTILETILMRYQAVVSAETIEAAFDAFESSRILCGVHNGPFGVNEINRLINESMQARGWIEPLVDYHGKPLLIHSNDYDLGLYNGDIGLLWRDFDNNLHAYFRDIDQALVRFPVTSLPAHSSAWAMTVHKSQGSEFDSVLLVLPEHNQSRALTRELLYTGITRARRHLSISAAAAAIETACHNRIQRHSGLTTKLGWPDSST